MLIAYRNALIALVNVALLVAATDSVQAGDVNFANGLYRQGRYRLAAEEYLDVLKSNPAGPRADEARFFLAESYLQLDQRRQALPLFQQVARAGNSQHPYYRMALFRSGQLLFDFAELEPAQPYLARFLGEFPGDELAAHAAYYLGESLISLGKLDEAGKALAQAAKGASKGELASNIQYSQAKLAERAGRLDQAQTIYRAIAQKADASLADDAQLAIGILQYQQNQFDQARTTFSDLPARFPKSELADTARLNQALCLTQLQHWDEAAALLERLTQGPAETEQQKAIASEAWYRLGLAYLSQSKYEKAQKVLREGAKKFAQSPQQPDMLFHAAFAELQAGNFGAAKASFVAFVQSHADYPSIDRAWHYLARSALECNDPAAVLGAYNHLSKEHPDSEWRDRTAVTVAEAVLADNTGSGREKRMTQLIANTKHVPSRQRLQYFDALLHFDNQNYSEAVTRLTALLQTNPDPAIAMDAQYLLGVSAVKTQRWAEAVAPLEAYLASAQDQKLVPVAIQNLGEALAHLEDPKRSWAALQRLIALVEGRSDANALLNALADQQYSQRQHANAGRLYERLLQRKPEGTELMRTLLGLGWCLYETKRTKPAQEQFLAATRVRQDDPQLASEAHYMAGACAQDLDQLDAAAAAFRTVFDKFPQSDYQSDAGFRAAALLARQGKREEADKLYQALAQRLARSPQIARVLYEHAWLALDSNDTEKAQKLFRELVEKHPKSQYHNEVLLKLAELAQQSGEYALAQEYTQKLEQAKPAEELRPAMYYHRGLAAHKLGKTAEAVAAFRAIVDHHEKDRLATAALFWLGEIFFEQGKTAEALKVFQQLLGRDDGQQYRGLAHLRIGQSHLQAKRWPEAYQQATAFLATQGQDPALRNEAVYVQARALQQQARFDEARKLFGPLVGAQRTELAAKAQFMIAETYFHQQQYRSALKEFLKVEILYAFPEWQAMALLEIGKCHEKLDEPDQAQQAYRRLLQEYPHSRELETAKARLASLQANGRPPKS